MKGGWKRENVPGKDDSEEEDENDEDDADYSFIYTNEHIQNIVGSQSLRSFINTQYLKYIGHICRAENTRFTKKLLFAKATKAYYRDPWIKISQLLGVTIDQAKRSTQSRKEFAELVRQRISLPP